MSIHSVHPAISGLSTEEVNQRILAKQVNNDPVSLAKPIRTIIAENVFSMFNLINALIAIILIMNRSYTNAFFIVIILFNCLTGIFVEAKAQSNVGKLVAMNAGIYDVVRDGRIEAISDKDIVMDDILILRSGMQVPVDCCLIEGELMLNEAMLSGESDLISKSVGDEILSSAIVVSHMGYARVIRINKETYASSLMRMGKIKQANQSALMDGIKKVTAFTSMIILPISAVLVFESVILRRTSWYDTIISVSAAVLGMLPKGLALLIILSFGISIIKLSKRFVLVQNMFKIEQLGYTDVICLDKTGTLTDFEMEVVQVISINQQYSSEEITTIMGNIMRVTLDTNLTMQALKRYFREDSTLAVEQVIPFNSTDKQSSVIFAEQGTIVLGAPEALGIQLQDYPIQGGLRVIALAQSAGDVKPIALIGLSNRLRKDAKETLQRFADRGVTINIISGDSLEMVSAIARQVGLSDDSAIDLSQCSNERLDEIITTHHVFARATPEQKYQIIQGLQNEGHTVTMVGDGLNDIPAMREADCGIALSQSDHSLTQIADIVLLDSTFSSLPSVLEEGRRIINNVTTVSSLFFVKTIYSFMLALACIILNMPFPFIPLQITMIDLFVEGFASFMLSFEKSTRYQDRHYLRSALRSAFPDALLILIQVLIITVLRQSLGLSDGGYQTLLYGVLAITTMLKLVHIYSHMTWFRGAVLLSMLVLLTSGSILLSSRLNLVMLRPGEWLILIFSILLSQGLRFFMNSWREQQS